MGLVTSRDNSKDNDETAIPSWELRDLENEPSYHWSMNLKDAEKTLAEHRGNRCYLTRYSKRRKAYRLSVKETGNDKKHIFEHFQFNITHKSSCNENVYRLKGNDLTFPKVSEMLKYYRDNPISHDLSDIGVPVIYSESDGTTVHKHENDGGHQEMTEPEASHEATGDAISKGIKEAEKVDTEYRNNAPEDENAKNEAHSSSASCPDDLSVPSTTNLAIIKWTDCNGKEHNFELIKQISSKWHTIGIHLRQSMNTLENNKQRSLDNDIRMEYVFNRWIENEGCSSVYPMTWDGVIELLHDIEVSKAAEELKKALAANGVITEK